MSKTNSYTTLPERGSSAYILTKELQRIRRFGISDIATRPHLYPVLRPLVISKAGPEPRDIIERVALSKAVFRAAFERLPSSNLRSAAAILFHLDTDSEAPALGRPQARR